MRARLISGRYELTTLIGQGGMGQVWTAHDHTLDRRVAVKLLRPDRITGSEHAGDLRRRFARECRVTARIDHPGLVAVHDVAHDGDDLCLVMQYVRGSDLADHLAEQDPYPWPWAVAVAAQLCSVLAAVHALPAVHRDLKPRNVMVRTDGTVVLLDLGLATVLDSDASRLTLTGTHLGSPAYTAPEQAIGDPVGPRTDLYSLGVILHELLSGSVPFTRTAPLGLLHQHLHEPPAPLRTIRPEVPEPLEALVLHLLAKDPRDRPADATAVYRALEPLLPRPAEGPAAASGGGPPTDPTRPFRRPYAPWTDRPTPAPPAPPVTAPRAADTPETDVAAAVEEARRLLDAGRLSDAVGPLGRALPVAVETHGPHSAVVLMLRRQYAATLLEAGMFGTALPELRLLIEESVTGNGPDDPRTAHLRAEAAQCLDRLGDHAGALAEYRAALPGLDRLAATDAAPALDARHRIARLQLQTGADAEARTTLLQVLLGAERHYGPHHPIAAETRRFLERLDGR
ncbi:protein kinase domain-containing protein [Kitasatospora sp. NPDC001664]